MLYFDQVSKRYESGNQALNRVSFQLDDGDMAFLTGHSGAGKSTVLRLIAAMEQPSGGEISYQGVSINRLPNKQIPLHRRRIGMVIQEHALLSDRSVFDNVALPLLVAAYPHREISRRGQAALDKVGLLKKANQYPIQLSAGEQQRVGIARAVVHKPQLLLADEPTGNLDPELSKEILNLFYQFHQVGVTVLIATHERQIIEPFDVADIRLQDGQVVTHGA